MADRRLKDFLDMIAAEKGAAPNTVAAYRRDVLQFLAFFGRDCALAKKTTLPPLSVTSAAGDLRREAWRASFRR